MWNKLPERAYLWTVLSYEDGRLTWLERPREHFRTDQAHRMWNAKFKNTRAGRQMPSITYRQVMVDGVRYLEHRIIAQMFGVDTSKVIDHRDGDGLNNRVENLRPATHQENARNNSGWKKKESRVGTHQKPNGRWVAYIRRGGRHAHLGTFLTEAEAVSARVLAEGQVYGQFARAHSVH